MIEAKPEHLVEDRGYDSDPLDEQLRKDGTELIAPHRCNPSQTAIPRRPTVPQICKAVARRTLLRLDSVAAAHPGPMGVLSTELPRLRPAGLSHRPLQAILR